MTAAPPSRTIRREPLLLACSVGPIALASTAAALARQRDLHQPAKLCRSGRGPLALVAEVPCDGEWAAAEQRAANAAERALEWLSGAPAGLAAGRAAAAEAGRRTDARRAALAGAVTATTLGCGALHLATGPLALRLEDERCAAALVLFALEANARLRFARLGVAPFGPGVARLDWDLVLDGADRERWYDMAVEALAAARLETERAARALGSAAVAAAYLATRAETPASPADKVVEPPALSPAF